MVNSADVVSALFCENEVTAFSKPLTWYLSSAEIFKVKNQSQLKSVLSAYKFKVSEANELSALTFAKCSFVAHLPSAIRLFN